MGRTIYKVHKWIAITVGLVIFVWLVSGIVMILPPLFSAGNRQPAAVDFREITVSPAEAVDALGGLLDRNQR